MPDEGQHDAGRVKQSLNGINLFTADRARVLALDYECDTAGAHAAPQRQTLAKPYFQVLKVYGLLT